LFPEILRIPEGNFFLGAAQMRCRVREESKGQRTKKKQKQKKTKKKVCQVRAELGGEFGSVKLFFKMAKIIWLFGFLIAKFMI